MSNSKISALPAASTPLAGTEVLPVVQGGVTEQVSVVNLTAGRDVSASGLFVDANSATNAVRITQLGAGNALLIEDSTSPDSTPFAVDAAGTVFVGSTTATTTAVGSAKVQILGGTAPLSFYRTADSTTPINLEFAKARASGAILNSGDTIGRVYFSGSDGTAQIPAAFIDAAVDGTPGTNDMPGRLVFSTTADGASSPTEAMRISSTQSVGIGSTNTTGRKVVVSGTVTGAVTAYGIYGAVTFQSDVTTHAYGIRSQSGTQAASFTLPLLSHYAASQGTFGATSAVTTQYGFNADSSLTGATNNYGFYGAIAAAANRYNFYAAGTAQNLFSGDVLVFGAGGLGYTTGSGGTVTQGTSRTTGVTLNKTNGAITLFTAAGSITATTFTVTNSTVAATDVVNVCQKSGTNLYNTLVTAVAAGSFNITFYTTGGIASDAPVFNFAVTKAVTA